MGVFHILEFNAILKADVGEAQQDVGVAQQDVGVAQAVKLPAITSQAITFTSATLSSAFNEATKLIRIVSDTQCYIEVGASPTATANSMLVPAFSVEYFGVTAGDKVSIYDGVT
jgi:hypothetical protein